MKMPVVVPIVIPTKDQPWYKRAMKAFARRKWRLIEDYIFWIPSLGQWCKIPAPLDFDFASVPRIFWPVLDPTGVLLIPSMPHDFGYRYGCLLLSDTKSGPWECVEMDRKALDDLMHDLCNAINGTPVLSDLAWAAVRAGGYFTWKSWRDSKQSVFDDYPAAVVL